MKKLNQLIAGTLAAAMVISMLPAVDAGSAKQPKLSKTKVTLDAGKTVTIKVNNAAKNAKVTWKTSNKKVAKIGTKITKGKKAKAVIKAVAKGMATISAKYKVGKKSKVLKCRVTVNEVNVPATSAPVVNPTSAPVVSATTAPTEAPKTPTPPPSEEMVKTLETIELTMVEEIRGSMYLPTETEDGATISWISSDPAVISDKEVDGAAPGIVKRAEEDKKVTLTAVVTKGDEVATKDIEVTVLAKPEEITEDDYTGYLFGHFIGEGSASGEQIYFATSNSGLNFKDMNGGKPVLTSTVGEKGVRDPYIYRSPEGDRFFLIATDLSIFNRGGWKTNAQGYTDASTNGSHYLVLWQSTDLVNWDEPTRIKVAPENAGMAWAPEMIYDDETEQYLIFFASSIMNPTTKMKDKPNAIYYVATRDFINFSETKIFIDNQDDNLVNGKYRDIIDTTVIKIGDTYYSASKDGDNGDRNGGIRILKNEHLTDSDGWEKVLDLDELGLSLSGQRISKLDNTSLEGPEFFKFNKKDCADPNVPEYGLMADQYMAGAGYLPLTTTDVEDTSGASWKILKSGDYSFDKLKKRHGTILRITDEEYDRLNEAYN